MNKKIYDRIIDIAFITVLIVGMIFSGIFAVVLTISGLHSAEAEGMAIALVVPVLGGTMVPMLVDDYKENCKSSDEDQ